MSTLVRLLSDKEKLALLKGFLMGLHANASDTDMGASLNKVMRQAFPEDYPSEKSSAPVIDKQES